MSTNQLKELHDQALISLSERTRGKRNEAEQVIAQILEEVQSGRYAMPESIFILTTLGRYEDISPSQKDELYDLPAREISGTTRSIDLDLIDFLLVNSYDAKLSAMCYIMRSNWGLEDNKEGLLSQWKHLESQGISEHFRELRDPAA